METHAHRNPLTIYGCISGKPNRKTKIIEELNKIGITNLRFVFCCPEHLARFTLDRRVREKPSRKFFPKFSKV
jgi:hypothetical protein